MSPLIPAALLNKMITCRVKTALKYIPYKYCGLLLNLTGMPKSLLNYCNKINNIKYFLRSRDWETILLLQHCSTAPEIGRNKISVMFFICFTTFFLNKVLIVFHTDKRNQSSMILYWVQWPYLSKNFKKILFNSLFLQILLYLFTTIFVYTVCKVNIFDNKDFGLT